jgi:hypothetical protein
MRVYIDSSAFVKFYGKPSFERGIGQIEKIVTNLNLVSMSSPAPTGSYQRL